MGYISVFDMLKIGVGPSSSHTLGPWRAAESFLEEIRDNGWFDKATNIRIDLYGSLSLTGRGHATDLAIMLGLSGTDPEYVPVEDIDTIIAQIKDTHQLRLNGEKHIDFIPDEHIVFNRDFLPFHSNGLTFTVGDGTDEYHAT